MWNLAPILAAAEPVTAMAVLPWVIGSVVILLTLARFGGLRPGTLQRGPWRDIDLSRLDLLVGFALIGLIYLDKLLLLSGLDQRLTPGGWLVIQQFAALGLPAGAAFFIFLAFRTDAGLRKAGLIPRRPVRDLRYSLGGFPVAVILTFTTLAVVNLLATIWGNPPPQVNHVMLTQLQTSRSAKDIANVLILAVVLAPLLEELVFRGLLQTLLLETLGREARWRVVILAGCAFAAVHVGSVESWHALPGLLVLGIVLGWLYERTGSVWPCIAVHAGFNALNIALVLGGFAGEG